MNIRRVVVFGMALLALIALSAPPVVAQTQVSLGGYVKYEALYDSIINRAGINKALPGVNSIPFTKGPNRDFVAEKNDEIIQEIRETRFNVTMTDSIGTVKLKAFAEGDFFGGNVDRGNDLVSNAALFRLRHAFGEGAMPLGPGTATLLAGQFWSAFGYLGEPFGRPATISFTGNPALFRRNPQLRLTYGIPFGKSTLNLKGAIQTQAVGLVTTSKTAARSALLAVDETRQEGETTPEFVLKAQWLSSLFSAEVAGVFTQNKVIGTTRGNRESEDAFGVQGTFFIPIGPLGIHLHGDYLDGVNKEATGSYPDAVFLGEGRGVGNVRTYSGWGGLSYKLLPTTTLNAVYTIRTAESSGFSGFGVGSNAFTDNVRLQTAHLNIIHRFWKRFQVGLEYEYQKREAFRQNEGRHNIAHFALYYFF